MAFSGALTLADLNDFITPSQACIKPVEEVKPEYAPRAPGAAATEIQIDASGGYYEVDSGVRARTKLQTAEISLNDCLACSGCITSAEAVLITMQSHAEVFAFLSSNPPPTSPDHVLPILSIAPQSLASLATSITHKTGKTVSPRQILRRVQAFASQRLGIPHTYDITFARHIALIEHEKEFKERMTNRNNPDSAERLPMLASACPGWICYVEKTHGELIPFLSRTKSPQQIMGALVKQWIGPQCSKSPNQVYHVTVMPCYDKKLEASRKEFYSDIYSTRDVDCVLTTGELERMMNERDFDLTQPVPFESSPSTSTLSSSPSSPVPIPELPELLTHSGSSSGSYLHSLIHSISASTPSPRLTTRKIRNSSDYEEFILTNGETGEIVFKGAKCYGFRNLQNVVRKVGKEAGVGTTKGAAGAARARGKAGPSLRAVARRRKANAAGEGGAGAGQEEEDAAAARGYDYVEVMACPGGCVNGGGQLKPPTSFVPVSAAQTVDAEGYPRDWEGSGVKIESGVETPTRHSAAPGAASERWGDKEWVKKVEATYWIDGEELVDPVSSKKDDNLPTPPRSPASLPVSLPTPSLSEYAAADDLARRVIVELCTPKGNNESVDVLSTRVDEVAEKKRDELFRTSYQAVESDVIGLAVKW